MSGLIGELTAVIFHLAGHCIEKEHKQISRLFNCFSCYQYIASRCVLWNIDLKSWVKCN